MKQIKRCAHQYAVAHEQNGNGVSLMRAYTVGALDERKRMTNAREVNHPLYDSRGGDAVFNKYTQ